MNKKDYIALVDRAKRLSYEYYVLAQPTVSDAQFDALVAEIEQAEEDHPEWTLPDSPTQQVGSDLQDNGRRLIRHRTRMLSCQKAQTQEAVTKWLMQTEKKLKGAQTYVLEWKYDGISCSLVYQDGTLVSAATRGDKDKGQDLLAHVQMIPSVPNTINMMGRVEVRGEIVCPKAALRALGYKDCRTAAAALTNQMVPTQEVAQLVFLAWQVDMDELPIGTERISMNAAQELGFLCEDIRTCDGGNICQTLDDFAAQREALPYPTDGVVIKIDNKQVAASLGCTEHHPKGNIAYKFSAQKTTAKVLRIEISIGATGKRTPVAYIEPVMIMGREVKQVSLYSENKMTEMGVTEGCTVEVGLSNDVTPKIYRVVDNANVNVNDNGNGNDNGNVNVNVNDNLNAQTSAIIPQPSAIIPQPSAIRHQTSESVQCSMEQSNILRNSGTRPINNRSTQPSDIIHQTSEHPKHPILKAVGGMAAMTLALVVIWETGLLIPLGILGLITSGILK